MKKERVKYTTIPELFTPAQAGERIGRASDKDKRGALGHLAVRKAAWAGNLGYYMICGKMYLTTEDIRRFNEGLPPIPQEKR